MGRRKRNRMILSPSNHAVIMRPKMVVPVAFLLCAVISSAHAQGFLAGLPDEPSPTGTNRIIKTFQFPATMMVSVKEQ